MSLLIIAIVFGLGFTLLAIQNTAFVVVQLAGYAWTIPLYIVMFGSLLVGLLIAWLFNLIDWASSTLTLHGKDAQIKKEHQTVETLEKEVHRLEVENARLRGEQPSTLAKLRSKFSAAKAA